MSARMGRPAIFTSEQVERMRWLRGQGLSYPKIAERFETSDGVVRRYVLGQVEPRREEDVLDPADIFNGTWVLDGLVQRAVPAREPVTP